MHRKKYFVKIMSPAIVVTSGGNQYLKFGTFYCGQKKTFLRISKTIKVSDPCNNKDILC